MKKFVFSLIAISFGYINSILSLRRDGLLANYEGSLFWAYVLGHTIALAAFSIMITAIYRAARRIFDKDYNISLLKFRVLIIVGVLSTMGALKTPYSI